MLPRFDQTHLQKQLIQTQFILLTILLSLIQSEKQVRLERLALLIAYPITTESRRRKLPRFLEIPQLTIARSLVSLNHLLVNRTQTNFKPKQSIELAMCKANTSLLSCSNRQIDKI